MIGKMCSNQHHLNCGNAECTCTCHTWLRRTSPIVAALLGSPPGLRQEVDVK